MSNPNGSAPTPSINLPPQLVSYAETTDAEWRTRKISIMGVVASFIRQLRPGQDLTKVSLPAEMLFPFSTLEAVGHRELNYFDVLLEANRQVDPMQRFLYVVKWYLGTIHQEDFYKKPYNPVLGETYEAYVQSREYGKTTYIGEQVSHHPPVSALYLYNEQEGVDFWTNVSFNVRFGGNHVNVGLDGSVVIRFNERNEVYESNRFVPDMLVKNVILGTKRLFWVGEVSLTCAKLGLTAIINFKESSNQNIVRGTIINSKTEQVLYEIDGKCSGEIYYTDKQRGNERKLLLDVELVKKSKILFPMPEERDPMNSMTIWAETSHHIINNDMPAADESKKRLESQQRARAKERADLGQSWLPKYFIENDDGWTFRQPKTEPASTATKKKTKKAAGGKSSKLELDLLPMSDEKDDRKRATPETSNASSPTPPVSSTTASMESETSGEEPNDPENTLLAPTPSTQSATPAALILEQHAAVSASPSIGRLASTDRPVTPRTSSQVGIGTLSGSQSPAPKAAPAAGANAAPSMNLPSRRPRRSQMVDELRQRINPFRLDEPPIMSGWMKMRNSMKIWVNKWFVLRPGMLIYYKDKNAVVKERCSGILRLSDCRVTERSTNKDGFSFKIEHLLHYPIYHKYGLRGETLKMAMLPVSWNYCILRVGSEQERKMWTDAIGEQITYANLHEITSPETEAIDNNKSEDEKEDVPTDEETTLAKQEVAEDLFQKNLINGLNASQRGAVESLHESTMKALEEWKQELDVRMIKMEKKVVAAVENGNNAAKEIRLNYLVFVVLVLALLLIGRYLLPLVV